MTINCVTINVAILPTKLRWRAFALLFVFGAGDIVATDSFGYGAAKISAVDLAMPLRASDRGFFAGLGLSYRRLGYDVDRGCAFQNLGCHEAGGALDPITNIAFELGDSM